jgi:hypothetical protein
MTEPRCTTPCTVTIDPADGGSPTGRDFVVRAEGHVESPVRIELADPPPLVQVTLTPVPAADPKKPPRKPPKKRGSGDEGDLPDAPKTEFEVPK